MFKKLILALVVLGLLGGGAGFVWFRFMHAVDPFAAAKLAMDRGDLRTAQIELRNAVRATPNNAEAHFRLGAVQLRMGDPVSAERSLREARDNGFDPRPITMLLAQTYMAQGKFKDLLRDFPADSAPPEQLANILLMRGTSHLQLGEADAAYDDFIAAERAAPTLPEPLIATARVLVARRDIAGAEARVDRALTLNAKSPDALVMKAQLLNLRGDRRNALSALDSAIQQVPAMLSARLERANLLVAQGEDAKAKEDVAAVLRMEPRSAGGIYLQAVLAARAREFQVADAALTKIANLLPRFPRGLYFLGLVKFNLGQAEQAADAAEKYAARNPGDPDGIKLLARIAATSQRPADAIERINKAIAAGLKPDGELLDLLARAYGLDNQRQKALETYEAAAKLAPDNADILTRLAATRLAMGDAAGAARDLESSVELSPRKVDANEALVIAALAAGNVDQAAAALERIKHAGLKSENIAVMEGMVLSGQLHFDAARTAYIEALKEYPGSLRARFNLARLALIQDNKAEAELYLGEVLKQEPANEQALTMLVGLLVADGRTAPAVTVAEAAHGAAPANVGITALLADLYVRNNDARRALELVDAAVKDQSTVAPQLVLARARAQVALGLLRAAQEGFRLILAANPGDTGARRALVDIMLRDNSPDTARALLRDGLAASPGNPALLQTLVALELRESGPEKALNLLAELQREPRNVAPTLGLAGDILMTTNRFAAAAQAYVDDLHRQGRSDLVLRAVAAMNAAGRPADAARLLTDWLAKTPDDTAARMALISTELAQKRFPEAEKLLDEVLEKQPANPVALNNLAWLYHQKGDPRARATAQRAWLLAPTGQISDTLGWILTSQGEAVSALPLLRQAARELPGEAAVQYHLAMALSETGKKEEAITVLRPLLADNVAFAEKADATRLMQQLGTR
ncbi:MAG: PEP-CTERM system TPR-repeat protein PrsT [Acetobacteraceae bacterium]|nr:PEP-CTERM system TPR-repeat protein PrsT [Acetobacteraceae bacterium]